MIVGLKQWNNVREKYKVKTWLKMQKLYYTHRESKL